MTSYAAGDYQTELESLAYFTLAGQPYKEILEADSTGRIRKYVEWAMHGDTSNGGDDWPDTLSLLIRYREDDGLDEADESDIIRDLRSAIRDILHKQAEEIREASE